MDYVPSQVGHHCLGWLLQNYLKIPAHFSRILPSVIVSCTPDLHSSLNIQPGLKILFDGYFNNNYGGCQTSLTLFKKQTPKINLPSSHNKVTTVRCFPDILKLSLVFLEGSVEIFKTYNQRQLMVNIINYFYTFQKHLLTH